MRGGKFSFYGRLRRERIIRLSIFFICVCDHITPSWCTFCSRLPCTFPFLLACIIQVSHILAPNYSITVHGRIRVQLLIHQVNSLVPHTFKNFNGGPLIFPGMIRRKYLRPNSVEDLRVALFNRRVHIGARFLFGV